MIHMIVDFCAVENCPADKSRFHRIVRETYGEEVAKRLTYEVICPPWEENNAEVVDRAVAVGVGTNP